MQTLTEIVIKIFIEAILISGFRGYFFSKQEVCMKKTIEEEFSKREKFFYVRFNFKLRASEDLDIEESLN